MCIPHFAPIANVIQMALESESQEASWEDKMFRPGDVALGGRFFSSGSTQIC